jgi:hypothetical protein
VKTLNPPRAKLAFREIILNNLLYVDKTKRFFNLINGPKALFLARPRRFGVTLTLDALEEFFRGERELFKDLWIGAESDYAFKKRPVPRLNMADETLSATKNLEAMIKNKLRLAAKNEKIAIGSNSIDEILEEYLTGVTRKYSAGAAILIDERDAPVKGPILSSKLSADNANASRAFYVALKANRKLIHFALVTGVG